MSRYQAYQNVFDVENMLRVNNTTYAAMKAKQEREEAAKRSAILDKVQDIIDDPLIADIDESCVAFEAAFGENAEELLNEVFGEGGLVDIAIGIDEE